MNNLNNEVYSAGILPYAIYEKHIYFLLGRDYDQKWSDFGGRIEPNDKGNPETTAIREFNEESIGSIIEYDYLKRIMKLKKFNKIIGKTNSGHNYYMYMIRIPYNDVYKVKFQSTKKFINTIPFLDKKYKEKSDIRWVSLETIENSLQVNQSWINLRNVFINCFVKNLSLIKDICILNKLYS